LIGARGARPPDAPDNRRRSGPNKRPASRRTPPPVRLLAPQATGQPVRPKEIFPVAAGPFPQLQRIGNLIEVKSIGDGGGVRVW